MHTLEQYSDIVGDTIVANLYKKARKLYGRRVIHINSTYYGGGVAEILSSLVSLMNDVGVDTGWRNLRGNPDFFTVTKEFHNALQGEQVEFTKEKEQVYMDTVKDFAGYTHLNHDLIIVHDPQPLPMITHYRKRAPWIWRCHIDLTNPNQTIWKFLKRFIIRYDHTIVSKAEYRQQLPIEQDVFAPAIDPLTNKNQQMPEEILNKHLDDAHISRDKPLITQISRFDKWKDPEGVLEVYKRVKEKFDCRLILCGSMAADDPEGMQIYNRIHEVADPYIQKGDVALIAIESNMIVNALQTCSDVIIQKSLREGFGLTVTEAMWKGTAVVASRVGGIPLQISDGDTGYLLEPKDYDGFAERIVHLLKNPDERKAMGQRAREHVREHFLITRLLGNYLDLTNSLLSS